MNAYSALESEYKRLSHIRGAISVLHWDSATMMPEQSYPVRGEQLAVLESLHHERLTSPAVSDLLDAAEKNAASLESWQQENLRLMRHRWKHATAVPSDILEALVRAGTECEIIWRSARKENNYARFLPHFTQVLKLTREIARIKAQAFATSPYEALLDQFDRGRTTAQVDAVFTELERFLPSFLNTVLEQQRTRPAPHLPEGPFSVSVQRQLGVTFMKALGFDFGIGRADVSAHPFCGGVPGDIRITTRYNEGEFVHALMGTLHETGHALYEQNLPLAWRGQPVGEALGMTLHESQSLLVEMQVCRSRDFLIYAAPIIAKAFNLKELEAHTLHRHYNYVRPGLIRVDADEVTYPLHIILRYRLEKALISGQLEPVDLPSAWREGMKNLLGIDVPTDRDGCMQDIHWTDGSFGYFPTYTLGALFAAQFYASAKQQNPDIQLSLRKGDFKPLVTWLKENIHAQGSQHTADTLLQRVSGEPLNVEIFKNHLKRRYLS